MGSVVIIALQFDIFKMCYKETNGVKITVFINLWKELDVDATDDCSL